MAEGVEERRSKRRSPFNGADRASATRGYPTRKGADIRHGLDGWEDVQGLNRRGRWTVRTELTGERQDALLLLIRNEGLLR